MGCARGKRLWVPSLRPLKWRRKLIIILITIFEKKYASQAESAITQSYCSLYLGIFWKYLKCLCLRLIEFRFRQLETYDRLSVRFLSLSFVRTNKHYLSPGTYNCIVNRGVNRAEISGSACKLFCWAQSRINILHNLFNGLNIGGRQKHMKILLSTDKICNLISVQSQTC